MAATTLFKENDKITRYLKEWTAASGVLKKIHCRYKKLMSKIAPLKNSLSQKLQYPKRKLRLK